MGRHVGTLVHLIRRYVLHKRSRAWHNWLLLAERGMLDESMAEPLLLQMEGAIKEQERRWNPLDRAPTVDELYSNGDPELIIGHLEEDEGVPLGFSPKGPFFLLVAGKSGSGKTVAIRRIVTAIEELNSQRSRPISVLVFDYKGTSFLDFQERFGSHWRAYDALGGLRLGLQPPDGVPASTWINYISTSFAARCGLLAAQVTIANLMRWLVGVMNTETRQPVLFPDFALMLETAYKLPARMFASKSQYLDSLTQYLEGITQASGELFRTFNGLDLERDLISKGLSAVFSVANVAPPFLNQFIADLIVLQLLIGRLARGYRCDDPNVVLILDDCDPLVSRDSERRFEMSTPPIVQGIRQFRELGVGMGLGIGALGPVSEQILNGMSHRLIFENPHDDCANAAKRALGLPQGSQGLVQSLEPGECIGKIPSRWSRGMLGRIDFVAPCRSPSAQYVANNHVPAKRLQDMPAVQDAIRTACEEHNRAKERQRQKRYAGLREDTKRLMYLASLHPQYPTARLFDMMQPITPKERKDILEQLSTSKYADVVKARIGSKTHYFVELQDPALQLLGQPADKLEGRGGLLHRVLQSWVRSVGRGRDYDVEVEWVIPGSTHPADVAWQASDRWHVFEIVVNSDGNLTNALDAALLTDGTPVESVTVVAPTLAALKKLKKAVEACVSLKPVMDRIHFEPVETFEKELWP